MRGRPLASVVAIGGLLLAVAGFAVAQPASKLADPSPKNFELRVVGPSTKPLAGIEVEIRSQPAVTAEHIRLGSVVKAGRYGLFARTDGEGKLTFEIAPNAETLNLGIVAAGYGPFWAAWSPRANSQMIPAALVAELAPAWSVGGVVVAEDGSTVAGAIVQPHIRYQNRPGDENEMYLGRRVATDAAGKWSFDSVPASLTEVTVEVTHPKFMRAGQALPRSRYGIQAGGQPAEKLVLSRGLTVSGMVTDDQDRPIAGALVRTKFLNDIREAKTDEMGVYELGGCEPVMAKIVVSAQGRATDMQEVRIEEGMPPVDFKLAAGGKVRIRVLDEAGNPVPKARVFFQAWRGRFSYFEFDHVSQYADALGVWQWNEAPLDRFEADICRPGGMQLGRQSVQAREEEYVFRVPPALVITGRVIDAQTRGPIKAFHVLPGVRSSESRMNWVPSQRFAGTEGQFTLREYHDAFAHLVKVEASGYLPAESRDIKSDEGNVSLEFALRRGQDVAATVHTPQGQPAARAQIALGIAGSQISITNGQFDGQTYATRGTTNEQGRFSFPPQASAYQLVVLHASGYAHVRSVDGPLPETIQLTAWASVEGTFRLGKQLAGGVGMEIGSNTVHSYGQAVPSIFTHHRATTDAAGRYRFERVFPGAGYLGRHILLTVSDGAAEATSSVRYPLLVAPGETAQFDLGGLGLPVAGTLTPPDDFADKPLWNFALVTASQDAPPDAHATGPYLTATVDAAGNFRFDDVPVGAYVLSVRFDRGPLQLLSKRFSVPLPDRNQPEQAVELGVLKLDRR